MKTIFLALLLFAPNAFAGETHVAPETARPLFEALFSAFPAASQTLTHSQSVYVKNLKCETSSEGAHCTALNIDDEAISLAPSVELLNLWDAMGAAHLPMTTNSEAESIQLIDLEILACHRLMPSDRADSYDCGYYLKQPTE
jgi:hypothetical protein